MIKDALIDLAYKVAACVASVGNNTPVGMLKVDEVGKDIAYKGKVIEGLRGFEAIALMGSLQNASELRHVGFPTRTRRMLVFSSDMPR